jgi:xanthine dehydrogenase large subunit
MSTLSPVPEDAVVGIPEPHESAVGHVTGTAQYTDDIAIRWPDVLTAWPVQAPHAHARITAMRTEAALAVPGVAHVLTAQDVPGKNQASVFGDEPLFPTEVMYYGHPVCWVLGETPEAARLGAAAVEVDYEPLPSLITVAEAIAAGSFQGTPRVSRRGDVEAALAAAAHVFEGHHENLGQEHFYLETQASLAYFDESGQLFVQCSTQHPGEAQHLIADALGMSENAVTVQSLRMGGGFGGKETQPHGFAVIAALGTSVTGRPVRVRLTRTQDITITGKAPGFDLVWKAGFDDGGKLVGLTATMTADGGWSLDLIEAVLSRALCHIDNAYWIPAIEVHGRIVKTNKVSHTAFRGFGGPQGILLIEDVFGQCAPALGIDPAELRRRNFYEPGQTTPYGQLVKDAERMPAIWSQVLDSSAFERRSAEIAAFNAGSAHVKRGLAITPVKFGISFNKTEFNQAGALVLVYLDGSVLINHGGTEMGQGLHTKMLQVAATALGVPRSAVRLAPTRTDKVPNASATSASTGADLNGGAVKNACDQIRDRMAAVAGEILGVSPDDVRFSQGMVTGPGASGPELTFRAVAQAAYSLRVSLSAAGYYRTEGLHWDPETWSGSPFKYYAYGAAATEVEVDGFTGAYRIRRTDIVHDVGDSLSPLIDIGQVEGGFVQGLGWLTLEELQWDTSDGPDRGRLLTQAASTYKLPSFSEMPEEFNVALFDDAREEGAIYGSKAVGEPPLMLALSVREALRQAIGAFGPAGEPVVLEAQTTPEAVFWAVNAAQRSMKGAIDSPKSAEPTPALADR